MRLLPKAIVFAALLFLAGACASTQSSVLQIDRLPEKQARIDLALPLLENLRDFGNAMAAVMLKEYRFHSIEQSGRDAYLYRFDTINAQLPRHAYLVIRLEKRPSLTTKVGERNLITLDGGSFCLVPADEPAVVRGDSFKLQLTKTDFREAFNPWCIGEAGTYPTQILIWFKDPDTKDASIKKLATLLLSAFPQITYATR